MFEGLLFGAMIDTIFVYAFEGLCTALSAISKAVTEMQLRDFGIAFGCLVLFGAMCLKGLGVKK